MTATDTPAIVVIPAAGVGQRMGTDIPKQYLNCHGRPLITYSLGLFQACEWIDAIYVAISDEDDYWLECVGDTYSKVRTVTGGDSRAQSVTNGLSAALEEHEDSTWVLVHDAARPCLFEQDMAMIYNEICRPGCQGFIVAEKVNDTVKQVDADNFIAKTVDRSQLWRAQTPQVFKLGELANALATTDLAGITDEASAMERTGAKIRVVQGNPKNIKVTQPGDLALAELYLSDRLTD